MKKFSSGKLGRLNLDFFSAPYVAPMKPFAVFVFTWHKGQVLLCDIENRGWCIPGGRVEPLESTRDAAHREALEEAGALLDTLQYIGCYRMAENEPPRSQIRWANTYVANVKELVSISPNFESNGRKFFTIDELPSVYYNWNALVAQVFDYSQEVLSRFEQINIEYRN